VIAEEQAFIRRCADVGDAIGSALVCGRIAEHLMRIAFLYCKRYAPYSKWFGKAFGLLPISEAVKTAYFAPLRRQTSRTGRTTIVFAQKAMADLHNHMSISDPIDVAGENYYDRAIKVIFAEKIAAATAEVDRYAASGLSSHRNSE
jgi:hypothetical protein